jgi:hypothetical protein
VQPPRRPQLAELSRRLLPADCQLVLGVFTGG